MFGPFTDVMPKALLAGTALWAAANYFVLGPGIAARVAEFDHLLVCERSHQAMALAEAEDRQRTHPSFDPSKEIASELLRDLSNSELMRELGALGGGIIGRTADAIDRSREVTIDRLEQETASDLARSGTVCGCMADTAIAETRTEWAIFTGTLSLVRPAPVLNFDQRMAQMLASGRCSISKEAVR